MADYNKGSELTITFTPATTDASRLINVLDDTPSLAPRDVTVKIIQPFTPFTMSATLGIDLVNTSSQIRILPISVSRTMSPALY